jgi:hypothetical protein
MPTHTRSRQISLLTSALLLAVVVALGIGFVIYSKQPKSVVGPGMLPAEQAKATAAAYKAGGWVPLQEPDSRFVPGTIFKAVPGQWPRWVSSLETCGVPKDVLNAVSNNSGSFKYTGDAAYGANAVLTIRGVTPGPSFSEAQTATFAQSDAGASAIDIIRVGDWFRQHPASFSSLCRGFLSEPNTFVAQESYRVGSGTYTLKDSKNAALNLKGLQTKILTLSADANAKITGESSLTLTVPVYTAVHQAVYANDMFDLIENPTRGGGLNYGDSEINKALPH